MYTKAIDAIKQRNKQNRNLVTRELVDTPVQSIDDKSHLKELSLLKAIQNLPLEKQEIIRLFYSEEYSISEISKFLKIPKGTVKSRLFKAREKLKSILKNSIS